MEQCYDATWVSALNATERSSRSRGKRAIRNEAERMSHGFGNCEYSSLAGDSAKHPENDHCEKVRQI